MSRPGLAGQVPLSLRKFCSAKLFGGMLIRWDEGVQPKPGTQKKLRLPRTRPRCRRRADLGRSRGKQSLGSSSGLRPRVAVAVVSGGLRLQPLLRHHRLELAAPRVPLVSSDANRDFRILSGRTAPELAYETPLFGPPWSIPMEFPTYQWLVAAVSTLGGTPLDPTGRAVSLVLFWLMLIPAYQALGIFGLTRQHRLVVLTLLVVSPFYIFWSRTFMIESTALAFSVAFLAIAAAYLKSERRWKLALAIVCGILAALTKITTFSTFLGAFLLLVSWQRWQSPKDRAGWLRNATIAAAIVGPAIALGIAWTKYADVVKARNPLGAHLTSAALNTWNFGTLEQRLSLGTWQTVAGRLTDIESHASVYLLAIVALVVARRRWRESALCLALFVVAILVFTNLHAHWYYAYANLIFLIAAVGLSIVALLERGGWQHAAGMLLLLLAVGVSAWRYQTLHERLQRNADPHLIHIAESVRRVTDPDEVIIVLGDDWSSRVPYYAERRALMVADWAERVPLSQALDNLATCRVGALVALNQSRAADWNPAQEPEIAAYLRRFGLSSVASFADSAVQIFPTVELRPGV